MTQELVLDPCQPAAVLAAALAARADLRPASDGRGVDLAAAQRAAGAFMSALGIKFDSEELRETPARMARAYAELLDSQPFRLTTFPNDEGYDELVLARDIPFRTVCEHHLLPFSGIAHVGYLPGERILGLSKLARVVEHYAARPQTQERLTKQIADFLAARLKPRGAGVVLQAEHSCMTLRVVRDHGGKTVTSAKNAALQFALDGLDANAFYCQTVARYDLPTFLTSGYQAVNYNHGQSQLDTPSVLGIDHDISMQLAVHLSPVTNAVGFEVQTCIGTAPWVTVKFSTQARTITLDEK